MPYRKPLQVSNLTEVGQRTEIELAGTPFHLFVSGDGMIINIKAGTVQAVDILLGPLGVPNVFHRGPVQSAVHMKLSPLWRPAHAPAAPVPKTFAEVALMPIEKGIMP